MNRTIYFHQKALSMLIISILFVYMDLSGQNNKSFEQDSSFVGKSFQLAEKMMEQLTYENGRYKMAILPAVSYSERTGLELGVMPVVSIQPKETNKNYYRPSTWHPHFLVSLTGLFEFSIAGELYFKNGWQYETDNDYLRLYDEFYGIGTDLSNTQKSVFLSKSVAFEGILTKSWNEKYAVGINYNLLYMQNSEGNDSILNSSITGYEGGWNGGLGPRIQFDNRNHLYYPQKGWMISLSDLYYFIPQGKNSFNTMVLDVCKYLPIKTGALAFQFYYKTIEGDAPFYLQSQLGGIDRFRGIGHANRMIDKTAWYVQTEIRQPLFWRVGATLFTGVGNTYSQSYSINLEKPIVMYGGGLRFEMIPQTKLNVRFDVGATPQAGTAFFITVKEAF